MSKEVVRGHFALGGANVMWGLMSPIAKAVMLGGLITPLIVTQFRIFGAMILFWVYSMFKPKEKVAKKDLLKLFGASLLAIVFNQGSFVFGVGLSSPVNASIIATSMPLWALLLSALYLKESITGMKVLGIGMGATGALMLVLGSGAGMAQNENHIWGDLLVLFAQLSYASYIVLYKNFVSKYSTVTIMKWMFTFASICMLPFAFFSFPSVEWSMVSLQDYSGLFFVVFCGTFLSYIFVTMGQKVLRPTVTGMYNYVQPVVASIAAICWGLDSFSFLKLLSVALIFFGVYFVNAGNALSFKKIFSRR